MYILTSNFSLGVMHTPVSPKPHTMTRVRAGDGDMTSVAEIVGDGLDSTGGIAGRLGSGGCGGCGLCGRGEFRVCNGGSVVL